MNKETSVDFAKSLIAWQQQHGRHDLPWQQTRDAYGIWLSEIMLQQTQVNTVLAYYQRFLTHFPTLAALAHAPQEGVLALWSGLGYYARARNLHRCAQVLVRDYGGCFPISAVEMSCLPGIGRSTAAAISVFAFGQREAILDGNVRRVLARCFAVEGVPSALPTQKKLWPLAERLLPTTHIESYTQGLMDLGALICKRSKPLCAQCPLQSACLAKQQGRQAELPTKKPTKTLPERALTLLLFVDKQRVLLEHRAPVGIWGGLLSLPEGSALSAESLALKHGLKLLDVQELASFSHTFTHFRWHISTRLYRVERVTNFIAESGWQWLDLDDVATAALPKPIKTLLSDLPAQP